MERGAPSEAEAFKVYVRIRPMTSRERNYGGKKRSSILKGEENTVVVSDPDMIYDYAVSHLMPGPV